MIVDRAASATVPSPSVESARPAAPAAAAAAVREGEASFSSVLGQAGVAGAPPIGRAPGLVRHEARLVTPEEKFESFVLRSFVEEMLPSEDAGFFGEGMAGNVWRSMLAEQIGDELAATGGVGIADMLRERNAKITGAAMPSAGPDTTSILASVGGSASSALSDR